MKATTLSFLQLFLFGLIASGQPQIADVRKAFFEMEKDSCAALALFETIKSGQYSSALLQAYAGATEAAAADCIKGAFTKLEYFSRGKKNIELAIEQDSKNPEIRFLRFATQLNAPNFLEYDNTREDKKLILEQIPVAISAGTENFFWKQVAGFMMDSGKLSKEEAAGIAEYL